jgi:nicotinamide-nucleotide amidase
MTEAAFELSRRVGAELMQRGWTIAIAESCTGGLVGYLLTSVAGSSAYFTGGIVAYSNAVKQHLLHVPHTTLETVGAVSAETAQAMAQGVRVQLHTDVGIATTGIAGPGGGTPTKPVGLVYLAVTTPTETLVRRVICDGDRRANQQRSAEIALQLVLDVLNEPTPTAKRTDID